MVGFSALMERDEEGTYARVGNLRREVIDPRLSDHQGRGGFSSWPMAVLTLCPGLHAECAKRQHVCCFSGPGCYGMMAQPRAGKAWPAGGSKNG